MAEQSMRERIARAIGDALRDKDPFLSSLYDAELDAAAVAALEAMREPEPRMVAAALPLIAHPTEGQRGIAKAALALLPPVRIEQHTQGELAASEMVRDWQTMIDAARTAP